MMIFNPLDFQKEAIEELSRVFTQIWKKKERQLPIVFKAPTGSGKTFMVANFVRHLNHLPQWQEDKAFIWITFSDDLAMQSKDKFEEYFENQLENRLITANDINKGKLYKNDIIFINWQKIVSKKAENRILRRPEDERMHKEIGKYWEDFIDNTHNDKRKIILIIDEAHKNKGTKLAQEIIDYIDPKIILHITATPDDEDELKSRRINSFIEIERERVVEEGLIKEKIVVQTDEDLREYKEKDLDKVLLDLGIKKRNELKEEFKKLGKDINPLMLIQLPNDDKSLIETGKETKEMVVCDYFQKIGIDKYKIAKWFDSRKENMEDIRENDSDIDFMLFKQAAGTGWDCPRASVLIMFREIKSNKFYTQTIGRILRMPEPNLKEDYKDSEKLRIGYLFTNYKRKEVRIPDESDKNKSFTKFAYVKKGIKNISLKSAYIPRLDYGDIPQSWKFQESFIKSMDKFFNINRDDILGKAENKLKKLGIDTSKELTNKIIVNAEFEDFDRLNYEFKEKGKDLDLEMSSNDVEKTFNYLCYKLLQEQTDKNTKITNIARSWSKLKSAIRVWFKKVLSEDEDYFYRIFIKDIEKEAKSVFRRAIHKAIMDFKPIAKKLLEEKKENQEERETPIFEIRDEYSYTDDYIEESQKLCVLDKFFIPKENYNGKKNEMNFKNYLEQNEKYIDWWFKNGDYGKNYFAIKYFNREDNKESLFYPDWIIRFKNGKFGIFDTKSGITVKGIETKEKAKALAKKLKELGNRYIGGIVISENGLWYYNNSLDYNYTKGEIDKNWKQFENLFKNKNTK